MLPAHHSDGLIDLGKLVLQLLLLSLYRRSLHTYRHLRQQLVNFYFVFLEFSEGGDPFGFWHQLGSRWPITKNFRLFLCLCFLILLYLGFFFVFLQVFGHLAKVLVLVIGGGLQGSGRALQGRLLLLLWVRGRTWRVCFLRIGV